MILLCPPEKSTQFHYPLEPKKIRAEGSMHKDTTYQGSDRQDFYRHGKKKQKTKVNKTNKLNADLDWVCHRQPSNYKLLYDFSIHVIVLAFCLWTNRIHVSPSLTMHVVVTEGWILNKRRRSISILAWSLRLKSYGRRRV